MAASYVRTASLCAHVAESKLCSVGVWIYISSDLMTCGKQLDKYLFMCPLTSLVYELLKS